MPLKDAIVYSINNMVNTKQRYKLLSKRNQAVAVAKAVIDSDLLNGIVIDEVVNESKQWLQKNVFKPATILKEMDLKGGTLNYEGIKVFNDVEAAAYSKIGLFSHLHASKELLKCLRMRRKRFAPLITSILILARGLSSIMLK